ncbi:TPA: thermostable hemolysin [Burkholderia vietnamiensis]|nr:thermostable hemolysin [Burkholderia vietnamiensis]HDR8978375.1 thermostable hemolysin [Burkholderia vietnamiensis]HDR9065668.1 thermostable hemolysin [Burkholderia vietnamiensis]
MQIVRTFHPGQDAYREIQLAVSQHYYQAHGARPEPRPDQFWCLTDRKRTLPGYACLGLSWGDSARLFSEHYLDESLTSLYGLSRAELIELGQFSSFGPKGAGCYLMASVFRTLAQHHYRYVLMTATERVRYIVQSLQIAYDDLGRACVSRVRDRHVDWGTYYDNAPRVIMVRIDDMARRNDLPMWSPLGDPPSARMPPRQVECTANGH